MQSTILRDFIVRMALFVCAPLLVLTAAAETTTYEYDALGRLVTVSKQDETVITYDYDAAGNRESKTVTAGGPPPNNPPVAVDDYESVPFNYSRVVDVLADDSDPDGDPLSIDSVTQPWNATVQIRPDDTLLIIGRSYGTGTFNYTISDGNGGTDTGTVTVYVQ